MTLFLISYDLRAPGRNYPSLYEALAQWKAVRLLESVWLADLPAGRAEPIRDSLQRHLDANDWLAVIELPPGIDWATHLCAKPGVDKLKLNSP